MTTSGTQDLAMGLLAAFYDLSGHDPTKPVPVGDQESPPAESAANVAGIEPESAECDVAVRYLLGKGYVKETDVSGAYTITVAGIDEVRKSRGLEDPATWSARRSMSDQTQKRLVTLLAIVLAMGLARPVDKFIDEQIPERRGIKDDLTEAALQGLVRMAAFFAASLLVRKLAELWR